MSTQRKLIIKTRTSIDSSSGSHRLQAWVDTYEDITPYIFVYQRFAGVGGAADEDRFVNIASASDIADYPETDPAVGGVFFRLVSVDLLYRSVDLLNNFVSTLQEDAADLIRNLDRLDLIGETNTYTITGSVIP